MNTAPSACDLTRSDFMDMDALLMQDLGMFIQCSHHALYFPTTHAPRQPELLPRERRLLLPLYRQGSLLGVLLLHGVKVRDARVLLPQLPAIADLCLELLARVKATRVDAVTGLATENVLYGSMEDEAARVREIFADPSRGDGQRRPLLPAHTGKASSSRRHVRMSGGCRSGGRGKPQGCRFAVCSVDLSPYSPSPVIPTAPDATPGLLPRVLATGTACGRLPVARCCRCP